jgi:protein required for attachment to host cells
MQAVRTWALIADGSRARILQNSGHNHAWANVDGMIFTSGHSATFDLASGEQQAADGVGGLSRSPNEPHSDPYSDHRTRFAHQLCDVLSDGLERDAYQHLIIAAPPATLGILRRALSNKVRARIVGEFDHDLTKIPMADLGDHLKPVSIS